MTKLFAVLALVFTLGACQNLTPEQISAGANILLGTASATITELNTAGIDPIHLPPEELAKYAAGCNLAVAGSGLLTGDVLNPQGTRLCELITQALSKAPTAATELTPPGEGS